MLGGGGGGKGGRESPSNAPISEGWRRRTTQPERAQLVSHYQKSPPLHTHTPPGGDKSLPAASFHLCPGWRGGGYLAACDSPALFMAARNSDEKMENLRRLSAQLPPRLLSAPSLPAPGSPEVKRARIRRISKASLPGGSGGLGPPKSSPELSGRGWRAGKGGMGVRGETRNVQNEDGFGEMIHGWFGY